MTQNPPGTIVFKGASLNREILRRGLTPDQFAKRAKINRTTLHRALNSETVRPGTHGKIIVALGAIPAIDLPDDLVISA